MRAILAACLVLSLAGCVFKKSPNTVAATPVAPKPAPAPPKPPPPPPEPLSIRQTNVELPAAQPISAEALNTTQLPEETVSPPPPPSRGNRRRPGPAGSANKPEPPRADTPKPEAPKTEAAAPAAPQIRAIVPAEEQQQFKQRADEVRRETQQRIAQVRGHNVELDRINGLLKLSADAENRGELRQAYELADRALVLAKELTGGK